MIHIEPANLRDASYVTANLRPYDREEVFCQLPDGVDNATLAAALMAGESFVAYHGDQPVGFFGTNLINICTASVWALGTPSLYRAIPAISRFLFDEHVPRLIDRGVLSLEARAMHGHRSAERWIKSLGGTPQGDPFVYGKGGELFTLFRWTVAAYRIIREGRWSKSHVPEPGQLAAIDEPQ